MDGIKYRNITVSGKVAVGTTTLAKNLHEVLGWEHINTGELQRQYDRKHHINENARGAILRSDKHEKEMESFAQKVLTDKANIIFEAWLSGFVAREVNDVLKVLLVCSSDELKVDRVVNRDGVSIAEAIKFIKTRENENLKKWQKLYGNYDFWDPKYYDLVIDTYSCGPLETMGIVLDKLGFKSPLIKKK